MSHYRRISSPYNSNPENQTNHIVKMQGLLEQYDRQNQFLGKQVTDLLTINKLLQKQRKTDLPRSTSYYEKMYKQTKYSNTDQHKYEKQNHYIDHYQSNKKSKYQYLKQINMKSPDIIKTEISRKEVPIQKSELIEKKEQACQSPEKPKRVQFTKDPYIETSNIKTFRETDEKTEAYDFEKNSPLKKNNNKNMNALVDSGISKKAQASKQQVLKRTQGGLQLVEKSLSKDKELDKSVLSRKSSRSKKSGIEVVSRQVSAQKNRNQSPNKIQLPVSTKKHSTDIKQDKFQTPPPKPQRIKEQQKTTQQYICKDNSKNKNSYNLDNSQKKKEQRVVLQHAQDNQAMQKSPLSFQRSHSFSFINQTDKSKSLAIYPKNRSQVSFTHNDPNIQQPPNNMILRKSDSVAEIYQRSQSQSRHHIVPSSKISHNQQQQQKQSTNLNYDELLHKKQSNNSNTINISNKQINVNSAGKPPKKKFITLITKSMLDKGSNIELRRVNFKR